jgi:hypothetical protein
MKMQNLKLFVKRQPAYSLILAALMLILLVSIIWLSICVFSYVIYESKLTFTCNQINTLKFNTVALSNEDLAGIENKGDSGSGNLKNNTSGTDKLRQAKLIAERMGDIVSNLTTTYYNLLAEIGFTGIELSKKASVEPLDFKDIFYKTQILITEEASKAGFLISDKSFGFETFETMLPKREDLGVLYAQLSYIKQLILLMIKTDMKVLKNVQLVAVREIESKDSRDIVLKDFGFKFLVECPTTSLVNFLLDLNKLDSPFIVNDLKVEKKKDGSRLISIDMDISALEPIVNEPAKISQRLSKPSEPNAASKFNILFKRDIFNKFELEAEPAQGTADSGKTKVQQILPSYRGFIELPDGTLIAQINQQNRTYFAGKGGKFLEYSVISLTKQSLELRNLRDSKTLTLKYEPLNK